MFNNIVNPDILRIMEEYLLNGDSNLFKKLNDFGEITGQLSRATILQMWNGRSLKKFTEPEIESLFEFLNSMYQIGSYEQFFRDRSKQTSPSANTIAERKKEYLESILDPNKRKNVESLFRRVRTNVERVFDKDIGEMSFSELIAGLSNMGYVNKRVVRNEISLIRQYVDWCVERGYYLRAESGINEISADDVEIKKSLFYSIVPTPTQLRCVVETAKDPTGLNTDSAVACLYWLGLTFDEIYDLLESDIDLFNGVLKNPHFKTISIPDEILSVLRNYFNNDILYTERFSLIADKTEYFIRRFAHQGSKLTGKRMSKGRIRMLVTEFKKDYEEASGKPMNITGKNLSTSGACWRLYQRELSGESVDDEIFQFESRIASEIGLNEFKKVYEQYKSIFFGE